MRKRILRSKKRKRNNIYYYYYFYDDYDYYCYCYWRFIVFEMFRCISVVGSSSYKSMATQGKWNAQKCIASTLDEGFPRQFLCFILFRFKSSFSLVIVFILLIFFLEFFALQFVVVVQLIVYCGSHIMF